MKIIPALFLFVVSSCGSENPYRQRPPKCKINCENSDSERATENPGGNGSKRESLDLPLDTVFWLDKVPLSTLSNEEVVQLLISNPFVPIPEGNNGHSSLGNSLLAGMTNLASRISTANAIDSEKTQSNPTAKCYRSELERPPTLALNESPETGPIKSYNYESSPGLCFSLEQVGASLNAPAGTKITALAYEDQIQVFVPDQQPGFLLSEPGAVAPLIQFGTREGQPFLPFFQSNPRNLAELSFQHLQIQGTAIEGDSRKPTYELSWDYFSIGSSDNGRSTALRIAKINSDQPESTWSLNGSFSHVSGLSRDSSKLKISGSEEFFGYSRIVTFDNFLITQNDSADGLVLQNAFKRANPARLAGTFKIQIPQPQNSLIFTAIARNTPCLVELFPGTDLSNSDNSLGTLDLCMD